MSKADGLRKQWNAVRHDAPIGLRGLFERAIAALEGAEADADADALAGWVRDWHCVECAHQYTVCSPDAKPDRCECGGDLIPAQEARLQQTFCDQAVEIAKQTVRAEAAEALARDRGAELDRLRKCVREEWDVVAADKILRDAEQAEARLRAAAEKAGVTWAGCDTLAHIVGAALVTRAERDAAKAAAELLRLRLWGAQTALEQQKAAAVRLTEAFNCLAQLCESNRHVLCGDAPGSPSYWQSIAHWIVQGRQALAPGAAAPGGDQPETREET